MSIQLNAVPKFDQATEYSIVWNRRLIEKLKFNNLYELIEHQVTRKNFEKFAPQADLFIFYDHGNQNALIAQGAVENLVDSNNVELLRGASVYTMCCLAAKKLGAEAYRKGVKHWWGYTEAFSFIPTSEEVYSDLANLGLILIQEENMCWNDAIAEVKLAYDNAIEENDENNGDPWVSITLAWDKDALVCWSGKNPPPTTCTFRATGIKLFGKAGQHISRKMALSVALFLVSYGISLLDFTYQVFQLKNSWWSIEGGYLGFAGMLVSTYFAILEYLKSLERY